jgi:hypothetical protein
MDQAMPMMGAAKSKAAPKKKVQANRRLDDRASTLMYQVQNKQKAFSSSKM